MPLITTSASAEVDPPLKPAESAAVIATSACDSTDETSQLSSPVPLEADSPASNGSYEDDFLSTMSIAQTLLNYPFENGRRYHKYREGCYMYPNDNPEMERLDLQYEMLRLVFEGKTHFAPLEDPKVMLDIGTGTGQWPIDMAEIFPDCKIIGTDLSAIQPEWVPENVQFVLDDAAEEDWLYELDSFDYIHTRVMLGSFEDFRDVIRKGFKYTKPGGWMESQEIMTSISCDDGTIPVDWPYLDWIKTMDDAAMYIGRPLRIANKLKRWYEEAGFVDVHERVFQLPVNPWPKDQHFKTIGKLSEAHMLEGIQGLTMAQFSRVLGWSQTQIEVYLVKIRESIKDRNVHAFHKVYAVWGRKPDSNSIPTVPLKETASVTPNKEGL